MNSILAIGLNTFKEAVRNRILYIILFFALIMIGASGVISELTIADRGRIIRDLGFAAINLFGVAICVFVGVSLVYNEIERKTIYTIVSKPIARWQFLLGKFFGLLLTVYVNVLVMTVFFLFMIHYDIGSRVASDMSWFEIVGRSAGRVAVDLVSWNTYESTKNVMPVIAATALELLMVTAFSILFSSFTTPTLSMFFTVLTFLAGRLNEDILNFALNVQRRASQGGGELPLSYYFAQTAAHVTPNLQVFHASVEQALYGEKVIIWPEAIAYAFVYSAGVLFLAMLIFSRRNFK